MAATPAASGSATPSGRFRPLDGLRGLAALAVVVFHAGFAYAGGGAFGVDLFFVLSGYLITGLLLDEHTRQGTVRLLRFWARRTLRLLPPLAAVLVGGAAMAGALSPTGHAGGYYPDALIAGTWSMDLWSVLEPSRIPGNPLFFTWTLAIEEQFYLLWPLALLLVLRRATLRRHATAVLMAAGALSWVDLALSWPAHVQGVPGVMCRPDARALPLLLGCALAVASRRDGPGVRALASGAGSVVGVGVTAAGIVLPGALGWTSQQRLTVPLCSLLTSLGGAVLLGHLVQRPRSAMATALGSRPLVALGAISYSLYLAQIPAIRLLVVHDLLPSERWLRSLVGLGAAVCGGIVLWAAVERPVLRRLRRARSGSPAGVTVDGADVELGVSPARPRRRVKAWAVAGLVPAGFVALGGVASAALARHDHRTTSVTRPSGPASGRPVAAATAVTSAGATAATGSAPVSPATSGRVTTGDGSVGRSNPKPASAGTPTSSTLATVGVRLPVPASVPATPPVPATPAVPATPSVPASVTPPSPVHVPPPPARTVAPTPGATPAPTALSSPPAHVP